MTRGLCFGRDVSSEYQPMEVTLTAIEQAGEGSSMLASAKPDWQMLASHDVPTAKQLV